MDSEKTLYIVTSVFTGTRTWIFRTRAAARRFAAKKNKSKAALKRGLGHLYYVCRAVWGPDNA